MFVKQISVFLENSRGALSALTKLLGEKNIDLIALSIAETEHYGILRTIATDTDACERALRDGGYTVRLTDVLAVCIEDKPGGLAKVLNLLDEKDVSVEYLYSFVRTANENAAIIFHLNDQEKGAQALKAAGFRLLTQDEVSGL